MPRGKTLHLGPAGRGQVHADALQRPAFKKLIEAEEIEVLGEGPSVAGNKTSPRMHRATHGHAPTKIVSRKGDR